MKTGIYFDEKTWKMIKEFADHRGLTISFAVRFCIRAYLNGMSKRV
ncbi:hypothetical protein ES702_07151 [subsurface metagenome]